MILSLVKKNLFKILAVSIVSAASGVANIWLLKLANDYALGVEDMQRSIMVYAAALMGMVVIGFTSQYFLTRLSTYVFYRIRQQLAEKISQLAYSHLEAIGSHRLYTAMTHDIGVLNGGIASQLYIQLYDCDCLFGLYGHDFVGGAGDDGQFAVVLTLGVQGIYRQTWRATIQRGQRNPG